ncbi:unnamed protein product [Linum tenue]|uniref:14-3-3 domain-containing protein n=1 Tax=Linum tenue TaxID=586396 RepID=A0AAV0H5A9_9ROSI|nr:unnamed protein product [Linum tenue]
MTQPFFLLPPQPNLGFSPSHPNSLSGEKISPPLICRPSFIFFLCHSQFQNFETAYLIGNDGTGGGARSESPDRARRKETINIETFLRAAWRIVSSIEQKEEGRKNEEHVVLVKDYRSKVENELSDVCASILNLLDSNLVPSAASSESEVFYLKMKGDYHRYMAEFKVGDERKTVVEDTMLAYKAAQVRKLSVSRLDFDSIEFD